MSPLEAPSWQFQVLGPVGEVVGGAVLLSPGLVVTCAHVVASAMGMYRDSKFDPPAETVWLRAFDGREHATTVGRELWSCGPGSRDLAVLRPNDPGIGVADLPVLGSVADLLPGSILNVLGYPERTGSLWVPLVHRGAAGPSPGSHQVEVEPGAPGHVTEGFSGCAVRSETGEVIGMMQKNHAYGWHLDGRPSGAAFYLPIAEMTGPREAARAHEGPVTVQRLIDESVCGTEEYALLHDFLDAVPLGEVPLDGFLDAGELERVRRGNRPVRTAWNVLTAVWDFFPRRGGAPLRLAWVHHVYYCLRRRRPVPPSVWAWTARTAFRELGPGWEEELASDRQRRVEAGEREPGTRTQSQETDEPATMAVFHLEQVARSYRMSFSLAYRTDRGFDLRPQEPEVLDRDQICDRISDSVREARARGLFAFTEGPVGLRVVIPRSLVGLRLGQTYVSRGTLRYPSRLAIKHDIVFHVRERIESADYLDADPDLWRQRSQLQQEFPSVRHQNVLLSWHVPVGEVADRLGDESVTICVIDSSQEDHPDVFDAVLHQGVPTIIHGPRDAVRELIEELLVQEPEDRVRVGSLARYLRERATREAATRDISLVHDLYGDELLARVINGSEQ